MYITTFLTSRGPKLKPRVGYKAPLRKCFKQITAIFLGLFIMVCPSGIKAQQSDPISAELERYLQQAAENNPELRAKYRSYLASLEKVPQANTLPDPELSFGYFISPIETRVGPQQARFGLTQMFPWFGTLDTRGEVAAKDARARFEAFQEARNRLFYEVKKNWYGLYLAEESIQLMVQNVEILETFESLAIRRYEAGQVSQVDVLRVQIEKEDLITRLELMKDNYSVVEAEFNELLNREPGETVIIADSLSGEELKITEQELRERTLSNNAGLGKLNFEASAAQQSIEVAQKEGLPKFGIGLDYIITGKRDMALTSNGRDALMARAGIQIPLYRKKYRAKEQQARLQLYSVQDQQVAVQNRLLSQLEESLKNYRDAGRRITLYRDYQIQRTRQAINILTEQYATSATDFEELLRLQRKLLDYQLARETALVDQHTAVARLEFLYGKYNTNLESVESRK